MVAEPSEIKFIFSKPTLHSTSGVGRGNRGKVHPPPQIGKREKGKRKKRGEKEKEREKGKKRGKKGI